MEPPKSAEDTRPITYFVPDTFMLTVTHKPGLKAEELVEHLKCTGVATKNTTLRASLHTLLDEVQKEQRLPITYEPSPLFWEQERENLPPVRGRSKQPSAVSL